MPAIVANVRSIVKAKSNTCLFLAALRATFGRDEEERTMDNVTARQQRILDYIKRTVRERGYPPTVREIGEAVGLTSSSSVHAQLANLERQGLVRRAPTKPRAMELRGRRRPRHDVVNVPLVRRLSAGTPTLAQQDVEDYRPV